VMREFDAPAHRLRHQRFRRRHRPAVVGRARAGDRKGVLDRSPRSGASTRLDASTPAAKQVAFDRICWWLRCLPTEHDMQRESPRSARDMRWTRLRSPASSACPGELKAFADDPLVTIGAHTITHCNLARPERGDRSFELATSARGIEAALQRPAASSRLSLWRPDRGGPARIPPGEAPDSRPR
jgi:hypothetical protein